MKNITVQEVRERLESGEKLNLLDVRQPEEHETYNIGGILLPLGQIQVMETEKIEHLKNSEIICYCRSGQRSMTAAVYLEQMGFKDLKNMVGGVEAYQKLPD